MIQPIKSVQKLTPPATLGWALSRTHEQENLALNKAFDLVLRAKHLGLQTRLWVEEARRHTEQLLHWGTDAETWNQWKAKVLSVPRAYLTEIEALTKQFEPLNPPLKAEHIRSFVEAVTIDRLSTTDCVAQVLALVHETPPSSTTTQPSLEA